MLIAQSHDFFQGKPEEATAGFEDASEAFIMHKSLQGIKTKIVLIPPFS
jgi:hypothetical protein